MTEKQNDFDRFWQMLVERKNLREGQDYLFTLELLKGYVQAAFWSGTISGIHDMHARAAGDSVDVEYMRYRREKANEKIIG